ncbi:hypothetical protein AB0331_13845 [Dietzia maris]|uniref:hypothetical protein n=1 Tax=Dietzia maris TaxID=37915 RepID=UPI00344FD915
MLRFITAVASATLALGLAGCGASDSTGSDVEGSDATSTTSSATTTTSSSEATTTTSAESSTETAAPEPSYSDPAPASQAPAAAPPRPPFMRPEDYDPYGPPRFVQCWERNAAVMSDGSIVTDTVNCAPLPDPVQSEPGLYEDPPRADGCVGPAAVCGYYDESGNPVWFDRETGETSPRYLDENGNPTMDPN